MRVFWGLRRRAQRPAVAGGSRLAATLAFVVSASSGPWILSGCAARSSETGEAAAPQPEQKSNPVSSNWSVFPTLPTEWTKEQSVAPVKPHTWLLQGKPLVAVSRRAAAPSKRKNTEQSCYAGVWLSGEARNDLEALGARCGMMPGMVPLTGQVRGEGQRGGKADTYLMVWEAGQCYRVIVAADKEIQDIDAAIADSHGKLVAKDTFSDAAPVLPSSSLLCPERDGIYMLVVMISRGAGQYWFQVWHAEKGTVGAADQEHGGR